MLVSAGVGLKNSLPSSRLQPLAARVPGQLFLPGGIFFGLCTSGKLLLQQGVTQDWGGGARGWKRFIWKSQSFTPSSQK